MQTPFSKAWKSWRETDDGKRCRDVLSLEDSRDQSDMQKYLENRLHAAFTAGWNRGVEYAQSIVREISKDSGA